MKKQENLKVGETTRLNQDKDSCIIVLRVESGYIYEYYKNEKCFPNALITAVFVPIK